jgi:homoserine kinase
VPRAGPGVRLDEPVVVRVPGSSANLGPGYDAVGLALGIVDEVEVTATAAGGGISVEVAGEGADAVPADEEHLVVRSLHAALLRAGVRTPPGLRLLCRNAVPHGRGLGSSATAVVSGVVAVRALLDDPEALTEADVVDLASSIEGHPDNAAASVLGGMTLGWSERGHWRAVRLEPHPDLAAVVCIPEAELPTARARAMLPDKVSHGDAAFTAGRAALLVEAATRSPALLMPATADRLHQDHREPAMPATLVLVRRLRDAGLAAVVSGAGPSVLVLTTRDRAAEVAPLALGWRVVEPGIDLVGACVTTADRLGDARGGFVRSGDPGDTDCQLPDKGSPSRAAVLQ